MEQKKVKKNSKHSKNKVKTVLFKTLIILIYLFLQLLLVLGCTILLVGAVPAPEPKPDPAPSPIFGLGLLGRLLAAYSRGEKEEDFGNCKCNRRTFHNNPEKGKEVNQKT